jgi:hypothetical protein
MTKVVQGPMSPTFTQTVATASNNAGNPAKQESSGGVTSFTANMPGIAVADLGTEPPAKESPRTHLTDEIKEV